MNRTKTILLCATVASSFFAPSSRADQKTMNYRLPVLSVSTRLSGKNVGKCSFLPLEVSVTDGNQPLRISFSDDTPNGSGETIRMSLWTAALTAALQKSATLEGVRISLEFKGGMDGPSAGAVMCLGIMSALDGREFPDDFAMTGAIFPDGTVGIVGGIPEKLVAASRNPKIKRVAVPAFQRFARDAKGEYVDLFEFGQKLGLELEPVESIDDAYRYLHGEPKKGEAVPSSLKICREVPELEACAADCFRKRDAELIGRFEALSSNDWSQVTRSRQWDSDISPRRARQRFEEGALFDAVDLIQRANASFSAYWDSWNFFYAFRDGFMKDNGLSLEDKRLEDWPIDVKMAFMSKFRESVEDFCEKRLGWKSGEDETREDGAGDDNDDKDENEDEDAEGDGSWSGSTPDTGTSDLAAQTVSFLDFRRSEGIYKYMVRQTHDLEDLPEWFQSGQSSFANEIDYEIRKLYYLMSEINMAKGDPTFPETAFPVRNAGPEVAAVGQLFRKSWRVVDRMIEAEIDQEAERAEVHRETVHRYRIGHDPNYASYTTARDWVVVLDRLLEESEEENAELSFPSYTHSVVLFADLDLFVAASIRLLEADGETGNAAFLSFVADRARESALRSMSECRAAGISCFGAVEAFQKAERNRALGGNMTNEVLANYWRASMIAKALVMAFRNGVGPEQGFAGYSEAEETLATKVAAAALFDCILNANTEAFLETLPDSWKKAVSGAAAAVAEKADDATWAAVQDILKKCGILLLLQSRTIAELSFRDEDNSGPLAPEDYRAMIENWGRKLLGIAHAATREAIADGRLAEVLAAEKRKLKGKEDAGREISVPEVSARPNRDGSVDVFVPEWDETQSPANRFFGASSGTFRSFEGKMVLSELVRTFSDASSWQKTVESAMDELTEGDSTKVRTLLSTLSDLLKRASRAKSADELESVFEQFDFSALFGGEDSEDEAPGAEFDEISGRGFEDDVMVEIHRRPER